jgi:hypothetical protein
MEEKALDEFERKKDFYTQEATVGTAASLNKFVYSVPEKVIDQKTAIPRPTRVDPTQKKRSVIDAVPN